MDRSRRDRKAGYGTFPCTYQKILGASPITASATTDALLAVPATSGWVGRARVACTIVPVSAAQTINLRLVKVHAGTTETVLTQDVDVTTLTAKLAVDLPMITTLTDVQQKIQSFDVIYARFISSGTIGTQPTEMAVSLEVLIAD